MIEAMRYDRMLILGLGLCFAAGSVPGCVYERVVRDGWAPLRKLGWAQQSEDSQSRAAPTAAARTDQWSVLIQTFQGPQRDQQALTLIQHLETQTRVPDLWVQDRGNQSAVMRGRYSDPADPAAMNALRQTRLLKVGNQTFESAQLVSLGHGAYAASSKLDLRQHTGMYSLQIGYYDENYGDEFRKAAEQAAQALRTGGDEAYYYHGPHRSMVTIGLFTDYDFGRDGPQWTYGPRIKALQDKHPYNLGNGKTLLQKTGGQAIGQQPSFLVRVN